MSATQIFMALGYGLPTLFLLYALASYLYYTKFKKWDSDSQC